MDANATKHVERAIVEMELADKTFVHDGVSSHFLQILNNDNGELLVSGNSQGLVHLALSILRLAMKDVGAHQHFDEAGIVDRCDYPLVISKCLADW